MRRVPNILWFFLIALTIVIAWGLGPDFYNALRSRTWAAVPCQILKSRVVEESSGYGLRYELLVEYAYAFGGREYSSRRFTTSQSQTMSTASEMERARIQYAEGKTAVCFVNPRNPSEAVLERGTLWGGLFLLAPLLIIGLMGHEEIFAWFGRRRRNQRAIASPPLSDLNDALDVDGRRVMFGVLGLVMGTLLLGITVGKPLSDWRKTRSWPEAEATIQHSELLSHSGMHGPEYSLSVVFEYEVNGTKYHSDKSGLGMGLDESVADMAAWVAAHPEGTKTHCFYDPQDPADAVLDREFRIEWISPALGCLMLAFGCFCFGDILRTWWWRRRLAGDALTAFWQGKLREGTATLRISPPPATSALGCLVLGLVCVPPGVWSVLKFVRALHYGQTDVLNLLYGIGALVGAGFFIFAAWKFLVQAIKPRPILEVTPAILRLGQPFEVNWNFSGRAPRGWLKLWLEGVEVAKVRRLIAGLHGSMSEEKTERSMFKTILLSQSQAGPARFGRANGNVPVNTMHSFRGVKGGIIWQLRIEFGDHDSDTMEYKFPITLMPGQS